MNRDVDGEHTERERERAQLRVCSLCLLIVDFPNLGWTVKLLIYVALTLVLRADITLMLLVLGNMSGENNSPRIFLAVVVFFKLAGRHKLDETHAVSDFRLTTIMNSVWKSKPRKSAPNWGGAVTLSFLLWESLRCLPNSVRVLSYGCYVKSILL